MKPNLQHFNWVTPVPRKAVLSLNSLFLLFFFATKPALAQETQPVLEQPPLPKLCQEQNLSSGDCLTLLGSQVSLLEQQRDTLLERVTALETAPKEPVVALPENCHQANMSIEQCLKYYVDNNETIRKIAVAKIEALKNPDKVDPELAENYAAAQVEITRLLDELGKVNENSDQLAAAQLEIQRLTDLLAQAPSQATPAPKLSHDLADARAKITELQNQLDQQAAAFQSAESPVVPEVLALDPDEAPGGDETVAVKDVCVALENKMKERFAEQLKNITVTMDHDKCVQDTMAELRRYHLAILREHSAFLDAMSQPDKDKSAPKDEATALISCKTPTQVELRNLLEERKDIFSNLSPVRQTRLISELAGGESIDATFSKVWPNNLESEKATTLLCQSFPKICSEGSTACG
ncbi:hypothetical protein TRP8649_03622 [Pelagimonas phthalicica]|uniref:Uncharacterized protein n=1 Tax=Pelagimonas phthalicica TaxID=1037362 RepID=A0A238JI40_9RHOB|nr:hypothetical protein [Pelagimonas phthalicica]TDS92425.1 hypothetical protein CLV87_3620 [Pelagimonas phthalicica]SMX29486.1 hypothetical protein TRP8649_03622 [Pelagimonas phthalicica]